MFLFKLFRRKTVRDYLNDPVFLKEYHALLEQYRSRTLPPPSAVVPAVFKESMFEKLSRKLSKTKSSILGKLSSVLSSDKLDEDTLDELEEALYTSDIGVKTTDLIIEKVRDKMKSNDDMKEIKLIIKDVILGLLNKQENSKEITAKPHIILVVGVNGNGKTTTIGKLAHYYKNKGKKVLIGAADTFRAAAIEQLEVWAKRSDSEFVKHKMNSDPAAVAYDSYKAGEARGSDVVLIDTAGRLHNKVNLMNELEKIKRVLTKLNPEAPHEVLLVLDATTGQNALRQAKQFSASSGVTGIVLSKLDGTAKGGVTIAINQEMDIPVKFIGIGEQKEDLEVFDPETFVRSIFE